MTEVGLKRFKKLQPFSCLNTKEAALAEISKKSMGGCLGSEVLPWRNSSSSIQLKEKENRTSRHSPSQSSGSKTTNPSRPMRELPTHHLLPVIMRHLQRPMHSKISSTRSRELRLSVAAQALNDGLVTFSVSQLEFRGIHSHPGMYLSTGYVLGWSAISDGILKTKLGYAGLVCGLGEDWIKQAAFGQQDEVRFVNKDKR